MPEAAHQLLEACASRGGERSANVSQVVEMHLWCSRPDSGSVPDRAEVGPPQRRSFRADEDQAPLPRLGEALQVPAQLGHKFVRDGDSPAASS